MRLFWVANLSEITKSMLQKLELSLVLIDES